MINQFVRSGMKMLFGKWNHSIYWGEQIGNYSTNSWTSVSEIKCFWGTTFFGHAWLWKFLLIPLWPERIGNTWIKRPFGIRRSLWRPEMYVAGPAVFAAHRVRGQKDGGGDRKEQHREGHRRFLLGAGDWGLPSVVHSCSLLTWDIFYLASAKIQKYLEINVARWSFVCLIFLFLSDCVALMITPLSVAPVGMIIWKSSGRTCLDDRIVWKSGKNSDKWDIFLLLLLGKFPVKLGWGRFVTCTCTESSW